MRARFLAVMVSLATAATGALAAAPHVYTNEDLELLGPPPADPSQPVRGADDPGWEFVQRFIDAEHARLVTERTLAMDERRAALEDEALRALNERKDFVGPYYGDWNSGWPYGAYAAPYHGYGNWYGHGAYHGMGSYRGSRIPRAGQLPTNRRPAMGAGRPSHRSGAPRMAARAR
jgi:hypothetical protein